jgi:hypothetical protein
MMPASTRWTGFPEVLSSAKRGSQPHQPGSLAQVADKLAKQGVNINYLYATGSACKSKEACHSFAVISANNIERVDKAVN